MNRIIRTFATAMVACTAAACIPAGTLPGTLEVTKSKFDDRQYVRAEPGWVEAIGAQGLTAGVLMQSQFKIGALIHSEGGSSLVARVEGITRITGLELNVNGRIHELKREGLTEYTHGLENRFTTTHSRAHFNVSMDLLRQLTSGTGKALVRVTTGKGYMEGDIGAGCSSQWRDRACVAIRNALAKAKAVGLVKN